jgi:hypothetical protein
VASEVCQQFQCALVLYSFGHDTQTQGVAKVYGRAHKVDIAFDILCAEPADEGDIEFELLDCQAAEVGEGSETGPKVVDVHSDAEVPQLSDDPL